MVRMNRVAEGQSLPDEKKVKEHFEKHSTKIGLRGIQEDEERKDEHIDVEVQEVEHQKEHCQVKEQPEQ